jgi:L-amino acid N-acyltransferase YncA
MKLRLATNKDVLGIVNVMQKVGYVRFRFKDLSLDKVQAIIQSELPSRNFLICVDEKKVIGYAIFGSAKAFLKCPIKIEKKFAYSLGIGVDPDHQRKGIGLLLKKFVEKMAKAEGYLGMYTDVSSKNDESLELQKKAGFTEVARYADKKREGSVKNVLFKKVFD